jgi:hypothetical protein
MNMSIELSYVPEPDRESVKKSIEEKKRIGAIFINSMDMFITSFLYYFDKC